MTVQRFGTSSAPCPNGVYVRHSDYAALEAECERLREDKARLDFYEANLNSDVDRDGIYSVWLGRGWGDEFTGNTFREAIDAARATEQA
jgi:hypothetical protein